MQVEFQFNAEHRLHAACRATRAEFVAGRTVLALCGDAQQLARLDAALWTFAPLEFVPHVAAASPLAAQTPVLLWGEGGTAPARDVLVLLDDVVAPDFADWALRYPRIVEIVSRDPDDRRLARERARAYRELGFEPVFRDLDAEAGG